VATGIPRYAPLLLALLPIPGRAHDGFLAGFWIWSGVPASRFASHREVFAAGVELTGECEHPALNTFG